MFGRKLMARKKKATPARGTDSAAPAATTDAAKAYVTVDYPQEGEIVTSASYALRITTSAAEGVDVSIDGKDFQPCRECVGHWWFDWSGYGAGPHSVVARIAVGKRALKSKARSFTVLI